MNDIDPQGNSPLIQAVMFAHKFSAGQETVSLLIRRGADLDAQNHNGFTALDLARHSAAQEPSAQAIVTVLEQAAK